jgi:pimeloyl-ACP methyl ester carboxylesterase
MASKVRLTVTTLLASLVGVYLLLMLSAFVAQRPMMYPAPSPAVEPRSSNGRLITFAGPAGRSIHAFHVPARDNQATVIVFHGNAEQLADQGWLASELARTGLGSYAVEYPGYGLSSDGKTTEANVYADANAALVHLEQHLGVPRDKMVLFGRSLGTGVAVEMASRGFGSRIILLSPYTSMVDLARGVAPVLPVQWLVLDRYDTLAKAARFTLPTLLVHGERDNVIPCSNSKRVAAVMTAATLVLVPGAGHNDLLDVGGPELWQRIVEFADFR